MSEAAAAAFVPIAAGSSIATTKGAKKVAASVLPKVPAIPPVPPAPTTEDRAVQEAAAEAARRRQRARGFRSTILSQSFLEPSGQGRQTTLGS